MLFVIGDTQNDLKRSEVACLGMECWDFLGGRTEVTRFTLDVSLQESDGLVGKAVVGAFCGCSVSSCGRGVVRRRLI